MMRLLCLLAIALSQTATPEATPKRDAYDEPPRLLKQVPPTYPAAAFHQNIQGVVLIEFLLDAEGKVRQPRVLTSVPGLDEAAVDALQRWQFAPARKDGKAVAVTLKAPIAFCIDRVPCVAPLPTPKKRQK
jgi:TonB family protein